MQKKRTINGTPRKVPLLDNLAKAKKYHYWTIWPRKKKVPLLDNLAKSKKSTITGQSGQMKKSIISGSFSQPQGYPWGFDSIFAEVGRRVRIVPAPERNANPANRLGQIVPTRVGTI